MRELLESIRQNDQDARNQLFRSLNLDKRVRRTIQSLTYDKSVLEPDDVKAEFWRGVLKGVAVVRYDIGDPVLHLIKRGVWQVKSVVRTELNKRVVQYCTRCGRFNGVYSFKRVCIKCGAIVENQSRHSDIDDLHNSLEDVDSNLHNQCIRVTKKVSPAQQRILELLVQACIDGSNHPQSDISRILGVSRVRVHQQIEKLKPYLQLVD